MDGNVLQTRPLSSIHRTLLANTSAVANSRRRMCPRLRHHAFGKGPSSFRGVLHEAHKRSVGQRQTSTGNPIRQVRILPAVHCRIVIACQNIQEQFTKGADAKRRQPRPDRGRSRAPGVLEKDAAMFRVSVFYGARLVRCALLWPIWLRVVCMGIHYFLQF